MTTVYWGATYTPKRRKYLALLESEPKRVELETTVSGSSREDRSKV